MAPLAQLCAVPQCVAKPLATFGDLWFCRDHYCACVVDWYWIRRAHVQWLIAEASKRRLSLPIQEFRREVEAWEPGAQRRMAALIARGEKTL